MLVFENFCFEASLFIRLSLSHILKNFGD